MQAAKAPVDCRSISSKPKSSSDAPVVHSVGADEARAVGIGRRQYERAGLGGAVAAPAGRVGGGGRAARDAVPGARQADDLVPSGRQLGHADGGLVGFPAGGDQQHAIELARRQFGQQSGQLDHRARQDGGIEVVELAHGVAHDLDDLGVAVADDGAHLAGAEVEDAAAVGVPHEAALRALGDDRREVAAVADEVRARLRPERGIGVARTHLGHVVHVALLSSRKPHGCHTGARPRYPAIAELASVRHDGSRAQGPRRHVARLMGRMPRQCIFSPARSCETLRVGNHERRAIQARGRRGKACIVSASTSAERSPTLRCTMRAAARCRCTSG